MSLFSWRRKEPFHIESQASSRIEVEIDKSASKEAVDKAKSASKHLNSLLVENGFTLKIYLAAHNSAKPKRVGNKR